MIRVMICDDQEVVCEGLRAMLHNAPGIQVMGVAHDGAEALELLEADQPELILMDLKMPIMNGIQATARIRQMYPSVRVLVLTTYDADEWVFDAIRSGAAGYILKDSPRDAIIAAIHGTMEGKTHVDPQIAGKLFSRVSQTDPLPSSSLEALLTDRELEVLRLLARGFQNAEIAQRLHLSDGTVKNYVSAILTRLKVKDRTQAALIALRHGLADFDPD